MKNYLFFLFGVLFLTPVNAQEDPIRIDSIRHELYKVKQDRIKADYYMMLGNELQRHNADSALTQYFLAEKFINVELRGKKSSDTLFFLMNKKLSELYNRIADVYISTNELNLAFKYLFDCAALSELIKSKPDQASIYCNIGDLYETNGNIVKSLEYYNRSLHLFERLKDTMGIAHLLGNLGYIHLQQGEDELAIEYFSRSLKMRESIGDKYGISNSLNSLAYVYRNKKEHKKALELFEESYKIRLTISLSSIIINLFR